jgi:hypothetical protein
MKDRALIAFVFMHVIPSVDSISMGWRENDGVLLDQSAMTKRRGDKRKLDTGNHLRRDYSYDSSYGSLQSYYGGSLPYSGGFDFQISSSHAFAAIAYDLTRPLNDGSGTSIVSILYLTRLKLLSDVVLSYL